jgi:hypothetical protein
VWRLRRTALLVALTPLTLVAFGCGSPSPGSTSAAPAGSVYARLVASYVDYARCARSHGMPNLPDPQVDDQGNDHYPTLERLGQWRWPQSVLSGCASVWDRVHAIRDQFDSQQPQHRPQTAASAEQALAFARCVRRHGFPGFPDPGPDGSSPAALPPGFNKPDLSLQAQAAINACRQPHA